MRGEASLAGRRLAIRLVGPWDAALRETRPEAAPPVPEALKAIWQEPFGDRRTELVVIGQVFDQRNRHTLQAIDRADALMAWS